MKLLTVYFSSSSSYLLSPTSTHCPQYFILEHNPRSSFGVSDQVSHSYKRTDKIIVLYSVLLSAVVAQSV
jgi:hypothetical protein